jgi:glycosyltransferase involved in cell wall biosynthesis
LLTAAAVLKRNGLDFVLRIAGEGPLRRVLEQQARDLGLNGRVEFVGYSGDVPGFLGDATFVVQTSDHEGYPNTVMEGMACGRAVVGTDAGDMPSLIEDGTTGFIAPRGNDALLVDRLSKLILDRDLCKRMGRAGRAKAEREFNLDRLVSETLTAYRNAGWKTA